MRSRPNTVQSYIFFTKKTFFCAFFYKFTINNAYICNEIFFDLNHHIIN